MKTKNLHINSVKSMFDKPIEGLRHDPNYFLRRHNHIFRLKLFISRTLYKIIGKLWDNKDAKS